MTGMGLDQYNHHGPSGIRLGLGSGPSALHSAREALFLRFRLLRRLGFVRRLPFIGRLLADVQPRLQSLDPLLHLFDRFPEITVFLQRHRSPLRRIWFRSRALSAASSPALP